MSLIHISKDTPIKKLQSFIDSDNETFKGLEFVILAHYNLHLHPRCPKRSMDLIKDLEHHQIAFRIG